MPPGSVAVPSGHPSVTQEKRMDSFCDSDRRMGPPSSPGEGTPPRQGSVAATWRLAVAAVSANEQEQEGLMSTEIPRTERSLTIDRRQLLVSGAAITATGIVPGVERADNFAPAELLNAAKAPSLEVSTRNVCAVTARRLEEIVTRNRIRQQARLPLLSIPKELRRLKEGADAAAFSEFAAVHRLAVWDEVLAPVREARGEPNWRPRGFMEGLAFHSQVNKILRERFNARPRKTTIRTGQVDGDCHIYQRDG